MTRCPLPPAERGESAGSQIRGIHHVGITVADLNRSLAFYRDLLDLRVIEISDDEDVTAIVGMPGARARVADLDTGSGQVLELIEYNSADGSEQVLSWGTPGTSHLSFRVDDLRSALAHLAVAGVTPLGEPVKLSSGEVWTGSTVACLRDPDGFFVELIERGTDG